MKWRDRWLAPQHRSSILGSQKAPIFSIVMMRSYALCLDGMERRRRINAPSAYSIPATAKPLLAQNAIHPAGVMFGAVVCAEFKALPEFASA